MPGEPGLVLLASVSATPLSVDAVAALVSAADAGAVVTFSGVVRDHDDGRSVTRLDYSGHPDAGAVLARVAAEIAADSPGVRIAVAHRIGRLEISDPALVCAVSAAHRAEAFRVCALVVDEVKRLLPVWKEQHFTDGSSEWVGSA